MYLNTFGIPAVRETSETYHVVYATVRAVLEGKSLAHAQVAAKAAFDAAADRINRWFFTGGQSA
jgi:hypothetical protein